MVINIDFFYYYYDCSYYDEADAGEDTNDDGEYPIYNFVPIILIVLFFLVYPSLYFSSNRRKQKNTFNLQTTAD
jgi:hypothetical protein